MLFNLTKYISSALRFCGVVLPLFLGMYALNAQAAVHGYSESGFNVYYKKGYVATSSFVLENGNKVWAEYQLEGAGNASAFVGKIATATGKYKDAQPMSAGQIHAILSQIQLFAMEYPDQTQVMTVAQYANAEFNNRGGVAIEKAPLLPTTKSVLVRTRGLLLRG